MKSERPARVAGARGLGALLATALLVLSPVASARAQANHAPSSPKAPLVKIFPPTGSLFGAAVFPSDTLGYTQWQANIGFEAEIGRAMTLSRVYFAWDDVFPTASEYLSRDMGRTLVLSWGAAKRDGTTVLWKDIASGLYDSTIDARATDLKAFGAPLIFVFHHEPNGVHKAGEPADYIAAFQHIRNRFTADGVTNLAYGFVMFDTAFDTGTVNDYYPGDSYVDVVGVDAYNWYTCMGRNEPWDSLQTIIQSFHDFGVAHHKAMIIAEWGSVEDPQNPAAKAAWFTAAAALLKTWTDIKGVAYFNAGPPGNTCNWYVDSSTQSLAAFKAMGADPYFNARLKAPTPVNAGYVNAPDNQFSGVNGYPVQGGTIDWLFQGPSNHTVTDASGMNYFDSGTKGPDTQWSFKFVVASNYPYKSTLQPTMLGSIQVPMVVAPLTGHTSTTFTLTWASATPPTGYVVDVQVQRPGQTSWVSLWQGLRSTSGTFTPDAGTGTYSFRSRLKQSATGKAANWSFGFAVTVT